MLYLHAKQLLKAGDACSIGGCVNRYRIIELIQKARVICLSEPSDQPILVGMDGGWVWSLEQRSGMEGKVAVVYSQMEDVPLGQHDLTFSWSQRGGPRCLPRQRRRLSQRRDVPTFASSQQLGQQAETSVKMICEDPTRQVVVIADGAAWIKKEQQRHFPQALSILDWSHLWREVSHAIRVVARAKELSEADRGYHRHVYETLLWHGRRWRGIEGSEQAMRAMEYLQLDRLRINARSQDIKLNLA